MGATEGGRNFVDARLYKVLLQSRPMARISPHLNFLTFPLSPNDIMPSTLAILQNGAARNAVKTTCRSVWRKA